MAGTLGWMGERLVMGTGMLTLRGGIRYRAGLDARRGGLGMGREGFIAWLRTGGFWYLE